MGWTTGLFEDVTNQNKLSLPDRTNLVSMKVRIKTGDDIKIFGSVIVPLSV